MKDRTGGQGDRYSYRSSRNSIKGIYEGQDRRTVRQILISFLKEQYQRYLWRTGQEDRETDTHIVPQGTVSKVSMKDRIGGQGDRYSYRSSRNSIKGIYEGQDRRTGRQILISFLKEQYQRYLWGTGQEDRETDTHIVPQGTVSKVSMRDRTREQSKN